MAFLYIIIQPMHLMYTQHDNLLACIICLHWPVVIIPTVPPSNSLQSTIYIVIQLSILLAQVTTLFYTTSSMQNCS